MSTTNRVQYKKVAEIISKYPKGSIEALERVEPPPPPPTALDLYEDSFVPMREASFIKRISNPTLEQVIDYIPKETLFSDIVLVKSPTSRSGFEISVRTKKKRANAPAQIAKYLARVKTHEKRVQALELKRQELAEWIELLRNNLPMILRAVKNLTWRKYVQLVPTATYESLQAAHDVLVILFGMSRDQLPRWHLASDDPSRRLILNSIH